MKIIYTRFFSRGLSLYRGTKIQIYNNHIYNKKGLLKHVNVKARTFKTLKIKFSKYKN